jgi:hypothetical protein
MELLSRRWSRAANCSYHINRLIQYLMKFFLDSLRSLEYITIGNG